MTSFTNSRYRCFLNNLKTDDMPAKSPIKYFQLKEWIPAPCLTSSTSPYKNKLKLNKLHRRSFSTSDISDNSTVFRMDKNKGEDDQWEKSPMSNEEDKDTLDMLMKERDLLKVAQGKMELGQRLYPSLQALVLKWKNQSDLSSPNSLKLHQQHSSPVSSPRGRSNCAKATSKMRDLERKFLKAREEEEVLKGALEGIRKDRVKPKEVKRPHVKLKKVTTSCEYKCLALKRKYEDILRYMSKVEGESKKLKRENDVLHSVLKESERPELKEQIRNLEQRVTRRDAYIKDCEALLKEYSGLQVENARLRFLVDASLRSCEDEEQRRAARKEDFEAEIIDKFKDTKLLYEEAIRGYKQELSLAHKRGQALEQELKILAGAERSRVGEAERRKVEEDLLQRHSLQQKAWKENFEKDVLRLEKVIEKKDQKIARLKDKLSSLTQAPVQNGSSSSPDEHFKELIFAKLKEVTAVTSNDPGHGAALSALKDTLKSGLDRLEERSQHTFRMREEMLLKENKALKNTLFQKESNVANLKEQLDQTRKELNNWTTKAQEGIMVGRYLGTQKDSPNPLSLTIDKSQTAYQDCVIEKKVLEERLEGAKTQLDTKQKRILELDDLLSTSISSLNRAQLEFSGLESKVELLEVQIRKKDEILDRNSAQLEERVREYSSVASLLAQTREDHAKQVAVLTSNFEDANLQAKVRSLEADKSKLESQLTILKTEKSHSERMSKKEERTLEEQVNALNVRNATLQKHLDIIQSSYKSMFTLEGGSWSQAPHDASLAVPNSKSGSGFPQI